MKTSICSVCGAPYKGHVGSTPCCGAIAYIQNENTDYPHLDELFEFDEDNPPKTIVYHGANYHPTSENIKRFMVESSYNYVYKSKDKMIKALLHFTKMRVKVLNKKNNVEPVKNDEYVCCTCGSKDGLEMPNSGYCYHCHTDNWIYDSGL